MMKHIIRIAVSVTLISAVCSCKLPRENAVSTISLPDTFINKERDTSSVAFLPWKLFYKDSFLTSCIDTSLHRNRDIVMSRAHLNVASVYLSMINKNFLPSIGSQLRTSVRKFGDYTMDDVGNDDTNRSRSVPADKHLPDPYIDFSAGLTFNWEADVWGKLASMREAQRLRYFESQEFYHVALTSLVSEVASLYFELIGLDQEKKVLEENKSLQELSLEIVHIQKAGGNVNQLAVDQFEAQLFNTRTQLALVNQSIVNTESMLNQMMGRYPQPIQRKSIIDYAQIASVQTGIPQDILRGRPDIRAAEASLEACNADVYAARAAFYPALSISGNAGLTSFDLGKLFQIPQSTAFNIAGGLTTPVFDRKRIRVLYATAKVNQQIALQNYEKHVILAFHEVYRTLTTHFNYALQIESKQSEVQSLRNAYNNSNDLFSVGYATYLEVITAQRRMLEAELELTRLQKAKLKNIAFLYRALGGGWTN